MSMRSLTRGSLAALLVLVAVASSCTPPAGTAGDRAAGTASPTVSSTPMLAATSLPTATPIPPTGTPLPTPVPPSATPVPPTDTPVLTSTTPAAEGTAAYSYRVVNVYPHDRSAFTQGLVFLDSIFYEGTGLNGFSTLRKVDPATGQILQIQSLPDQFFGEGIAVLGDRIFQLTWLSRVGFVYDKESLGLLQTFHYPTEGWGLTHDGSQLIMSDGTETLHFLDPETLQETGRVQVYDDRLLRNAAYGKRSGIEACHMRCRKVWNECRHITKIDRNDRIQIFTADRRYRNRCFLDIRFAPPGCSDRDFFEGFVCSLASWRVLCEKSG